MAHPRKLIRQAVVAALVAANTSAGARVQPTRIEPHKKTQLPAISVYTLSDPVDEDASTQTEEVHELEVEIAGWVAHTDTLSADDAMDDLAEQIESAMTADPYLGGKAGDSRLVGTLMQVVEDNARSDPQIGIVVLTYAVQYRTDLTVSADDLDDFEVVHADHRIVGAVAANQASDEFVVEEPTP
jgi:hypothetical protein